MKGMRLVPILAILSIIGSIIFCNVSAKNRMTTENSQENEEEESSEYSWVEPPIPDFVLNYLDSADWSADTICVVNGRAYYFATDMFSRTSIIYDESKIYADDPTLYYDSVETKEPYKFMIHTATKRLEVDFANKQSVAKMDIFKNMVKETKRYHKDFFSPVGNHVVYGFEVDFQSENSKQSTVVNNWLVSIINKSLTCEETLPDETALHIGYSKHNYNHWKYKGKSNDYKKIAEFASDRYFALKRIEYGDSACDYPYALFFALSLRKSFETENIVSYQKYSHEYNGGAHGYYTESIVSLDKKNNEEITWDYLFTPGSRKQVMSIFYDIVKNDKDYQYWENTESIKIIREHFESSLDAALCDGELVLPQPGLSEEGIVFSFQPYAISCFAAGVFHFTIPYKLVMPYLTDKAKRQIKLA